MTCNRVYSEPLQKSPHRPTAPVCNSYGCELSKTGICRACNRVYKKPYRNTRKACPATVCNSYCNSPQKHCLLFLSVTGLYLGAVTNAKNRRRGKNPRAVTCIRYIVSLH